MAPDNNILRGDMEEIRAALGEKVRLFSGRTVLITGGAGFLGYYLINFLLHANSFLEKKCRVVCVDNFIRGVPKWLDAFGERPDLETVRADITRFDPRPRGQADYLIHAASIASPTFYRQYPIETMDANIIGLRLLLDFCVERKAEGAPVKSFLFFSSSEIYGDPAPNAIPTREDYRGFVSCTGPRACYDESKRFGETLCVNFHRVHGVPVKIARPFNNYGPGLDLNDRRVLPDFCKNVLAGQDIRILSDGSPTRTFCYVSDAVAGYLLMLLSDREGEPFNIGMDKPEISMRDLAQTVIRTAETHLGIKGLKMHHAKSEESDYLTDNPDRRCPDVAKAREQLGFNPRVGLDEGIRRTLLWYRSEGAIRQ